MHLHPCIIVAKEFTKINTFIEKKQNLIVKKRQHNKVKGANLKL